MYCFNMKYSCKFENETEKCYNKRTHAMTQKI